jgi:hypothetical protein
MMLRKMIETPSLNLKENKIMFGKPNGGPSRYADSWPSNHAAQVTAFRFRPNKEYHI